MAKAAKTEQSTTGTIALDSKDLSILALLQQNARMTVKEIADKIDLSTTPVHERIKRMETNGVIKQYATLVDPAKVVLRCNDCIFYHIDRSIQEGATREELLESYNIGLIVGGSIVIPHLRYAFEMMDEIFEESKNE